MADISPYDMHVIIIELGKALTASYHYRLCFIIYAAPLTSHHRFLQPRETKLFKQEIYDRKACIMVRQHGSLEKDVNANEAAWEAAKGRFHGDIADIGWWLIVHRRCLGRHKGMSIFSLLLEWAGTFYTYLFWINYIRWCMITRIWGATIPIDSSRQDSATSSNSVSVSTLTLCLVGCFLRSSRRCCIYSFAFVPGSHSAIQNVWLTVAASTSIPDWLLF